MGRVKGKREEEGVKVDMVVLAAQGRLSVCDFALMFMCVRACERD